MQTKQFRAFLAQVRQLTPQQRKQTLEQIQKRCDINTVETVLDSIDGCPRCGSTDLYRWGINAGIQRYKCKSCNRTLNALTNTPLARLRHKEQWSRFTQDLIDGISIQSAADHCGVAGSTSFRWRHRFLKIPSQIKTKRLEGIVEADETYFLSRTKGSGTLTANPVSVEAKQVREDFVKNKFLY